MRYGVALALVILFFLALSIGLRIWDRNECLNKGGQYVSGPYPGCIEPQPTPK